MPSLALLPPFSIVSQSCITLGSLPDPSLYKSLLYQKDLDECAVWVKNRIFCLPILFGIYFSLSRLIFWIKSKKTIFLLYPGLPVFQPPPLSASYFWIVIIHPAFFLSFLFCLKTFIFFSFENWTKLSHYIYIVSILLFSWDFRFIGVRVEFWKTNFGTDICFFL